MTEEIMQSFRELLTKTEWIDTETKGLAIQKLDAMKLRIGYPDFILDPQLLNQRYEDVRNCMYRSEITDFCFPTAVWGMVEMGGGDSSVNELYSNRTECTAVPY